MFRNGPFSNNEDGIRQINVESDSKLTLPEHLVDLFNRSDEDLNEVEQKHLKILLIDFQDVFAKHDLDLRCLLAIKHCIDIKDDNPVKHKMRRTPLGFQHQEEEHLKKMLDAGIIQLSNS